MSQQQVSAGFDSTKVTVGSLVVAIRKDDVPTNESVRLASDVEFYPLTMDKNGFLRVTLPTGTEVKTVELETLLETMSVLKEIRDLLIELT